MAKVLFIQQEASEKFGVMSLAASLKQAGHQPRMFIELLEKENVLNFIHRWQPEAIAFSITTMEKDWATSLTKKIKKQNRVVTIFGGADPTYDPEGLLKLPQVDLVCRGEGEIALVEVIKRLNEKKSLKGVNNIWAKENGKIVRNPLARLINDLDWLPLPDREIYYRYPLLKNLGTKKFLCSRGCPYQCTYCSNHAYQKIFAGLGQYIRFRQPQSVISEIKQVKEKYGLKNVYFADETFTLNHEWLFKFLPLYQKKIGLPFSCLGRVNEMNEKIIKLLKESGCFYLAFGVESGSERIRNKILKRNMATRDILQIAKRLHQYKIPFLTHQMYVLPTETVAEALSTVKLNMEIKADSVWDTVFQPFKNTAIYNYCRQKKLLPNNLRIDSMFGHSQIVNWDKKVIENIRRLAWLNIKLPFLWPLTKKLVYWPNNLIFEGILKVSEVYSLRRYRLSFWEMIKLARGTGNKLG